jgi:hypothetical protein
MTSLRVLGSLVLALAALALSGCIEKEKGKERAIVHGGDQVPLALDGWVAVPPGNAPEAGEAKEVNAKYLRFNAYAIVPENVSNWILMSPRRFESLTGVKLAETKAPAQAAWPMIAYKSVPKDREGWIGVPAYYPEVVKESAFISAGSVIPKEAHGWVALSKEDVERLAEAKAKKDLLTIPEKKK